jgi:hypothetical protein
VGVDVSTKVVWPLTLTGTRPYNAIHHDEDFHIYQMQILLKEINTGVLENVRVS